MRAARNGLICNGSFGRSTTQGGSQAYDEGSIPFTRSISPDPTSAAATERPLAYLGGRFRILFIFLKMAVDGVCLSAYNPRLAAAVAGRRVRQPVVGSGFGSGG